MRCGKRTQWLWICGLIGSLVIGLHVPSFAAGLQSIAQNELCLDGTLLFCEDFGGNAPNDPEVSTTPVPGMSYTQLKSNAFGGMAQGRYLVTKKGYRNSSNPNYSVWHIMDDHTHFDDYSRGYFMEIDGKGDNAEFYKTTLDGLCAGSKLTFSAWVANLTTAGQYNVWRYDRAYVHPKLTFSIVNRDTREVIAEYQTDTIAHDWSLFGVSNAWQYSANWQQVGMNFIVPEGVNAVELSIRNAVNSNAAGNDFAMDDIEIRLCMPKPEIVSDHEVCQDSAYSFAVDFTNDGTLAEPLSYKWWHSADSITWTEKTTFSGATPTLAAVQATDSGWYKVAVAGAGNIESVNCRTISEPFRLRVAKCIPPDPELCMDGTLLFREDFGGNDPNDPRISTTPVPGMTYNQLTDDRFGSMRSGSYLVTKQGYCNGDTSITNLPQNRGSQWHLQDDHTYPDDNTRGYFMEVDGKGDNAAFYTTIIDGLCAGTDLSFIAYVANLVTWGQYTGRPGYFAYPRLLFRLTDPDNGQELAAYDTGEIPFDSTFMGDYKCWQYSSKWHQVGMNFTVPENISSVKLTIYNNSQGSIGNDFALDDIEIRLCMPKPEIVSDHEVCQDSAYSFAVDFTNDGTLAEPLAYKWWHSADSITWTENTTFSGATPTLPAVQATDSGWYKVAIAGAGNIESVNCRTISEPFRLNVQACAPPPPPPCPDIHYISRDTTVCDTLMPFTWHGLVFNEPSSQTITLQDEHGCDTLQATWTLHAQACCPSPWNFSIFRSICDTLIPCEVVIQNERTGVDTVLYVDKADTIQFTWPHSTWTECIGTIVTVVIEIRHCEPESGPTLYPIIVNKYDWQLLCDNVAVRRIFLDRTVLGYQWYKDNMPIPGANEDDYAEQNLLHGVFQLQLTLDGQETVWSNILEILDTPAQQPIEKRIYHWHGLTIIRYRQGDRVWVEKQLKIEN